jgi:phasin family protein
MAKTHTTSTNGAFDFGKVVARFHPPGVDVEALAASQRRNIEALTQANQVALEGAQAVLRRQFEIGRQTADEVWVILRDAAQPNASAEDRIAKQAEYSKQAIERGLANAREIAELVTKASTEAFDVITKRVTESLAEVRDYATKRLPADADAR